MEDAKLISDKILNVSRHYQEIQKKSWRPPPPCGARVKFSLGSETVVKALDDGAAKQMLTIIRHEKQVCVQLLKINHIHVCCDDE